MQNGCTIIRWRQNFIFASTFLLSLCLGCQRFHNKLNHDPLSLGFICNFRALLTVRRYKPFKAASRKGTRFSECRTHCIFDGCVIYSDWVTLDCGLIRQRGRQTDRQTHTNQWSIIKYMFLIYQMSNLTCSLSYMFLIYQTSDLICSLCYMFVIYQETFTIATVKSAGFVTGDDECENWMHSCLPWAGVGVVGRIALVVLTLRAFGLTSQI